jgi:hypothetical protein
MTYLNLCVYDLRGKGGGEKVAWDLVYVYIYNYDTKEANPSNVPIPPLFPFFSGETRESQQDKSFILACPLLSNQ